MSSFPARYEVLGLIIRQLVPSKQVSSLPKNRASDSFPRFSRGLYVRINLTPQIPFFISGDLTDEEAIMDFLASPEALELEDQIEEVNARHLEKLVKERPFVAVFFCKFIELDLLISTNYILLLIFYATSMP